MVDGTTSSIDPKFIQRWAEVYVDKLLKDKNDARMWAHRFLPRVCIDQVAEASREILKKKGFKVVE